jgi:hypothetical protein
MELYFHVLLISALFANIVAKIGKNGSTHEKKLCLRAFGQPFSVPSF